MKDKLKKLLKSRVFYVLLGLAIAVTAVNGFLGRVEKYNKEFEQYSVNPEISEEPDYEPPLAEPKKEPEAKPQPVQEEKNDEPEKTVQTAAPVVAISLPVEGELIAEHSNGELVYSKTMEDWRTHNGIDIAAEMGTAVKAAADGVVKQSAYDGMNGYCLTVEHNGFYTKYCGLQKDSMVPEGTSVKAGDVIGGVGATCETEIAEAPHIHFELIKGDKSVNPLNYISGEQLY